MARRALAAARLAPRQGAVCGSARAARGGLRCGQLLAQGLAMVLLRRDHGDPALVGASPSAAGLNSTTCSGTACGDSSRCRCKGTPRSRDACIAPASSSTVEPGGAARQGLRWPRAPSTGRGRSGCAPCRVPASPAASCNGRCAPHRSAGRARPRRPACPARCRPSPGAWPRAAGCRRAPARLRAPRSSPPRRRAPRASHAIAARRAPALQLASRGRAAVLCGASAISSTSAASSPRLASACTSSATWRCWSGWSCCSPKISSRGAAASAGRAAQARTKTAPRR